MDAKLAHVVRATAAKARRLAATFPAGIDKDALPWRVIEAFDADVRGHVERNRRIEEERDRVLIMAVTLAEAPQDGADEAEEARRGLVDAVDYLEQAVLRFGIVNRAAARLSYGDAGASISTER